ncbi:archease [Halorubrum sp. Hd13]|uniref:archease n=1 Tax=Halorubrum sp. Hd13 TaxID=1480728 RepID=UPI000B990B4F|nr:archease [Halorubrum sp. Hd13]OYR45748.1 protein archease [Halorubrum sp. Hd13]
MSFALRDHTADVAVEATAPTLAGLFEAVADGLTTASCEAVPETGERFSLTVRAEGREALLFDYLDRLIYERDVRLVLPADHRCSVSGPNGSAADGDDATADSTADDDDATADPDGWTVEATARGVPLGDVAAREIKAVTYSEMTLERRSDEWYAYVVFDV